MKCWNNNTLLWTSLSVASLFVELLLLEGRAIDIQSKANLVLAWSSRAPKAPKLLHLLISKLSVIAMEILVLTMSRQFPKLCMSMALLHSSKMEWVFTGQICPEQLHRGKLWVRERLAMVETWTETSQVPSEKTTQGQRNQRCQQEVGDSVEVEWREGHHGDGQR